MMQRADVGEERARKNRHDESSPPYSRNAPPTFHVAPRASVTAPRFLFVSVDSGGSGSSSSSQRGGQQRAPRVAQISKRVRSHVTAYTHEEKRRQRADKRQQAAARGRNNSSDGDADAGDSRSLAVARPDVFERLQGGVGADIDAHRVDPFNVLPVKGSPLLDRAVRYYFENYAGATPLTDDTQVLHTNLVRRSSVKLSQTQWNTCSSEKACYYLLLYAVQMMDDMAKNRDPSRARWLYLDKAIQAIRDGIPTPEHKKPISDSYVAIVASLGASEGMAENWSSAANHINGMIALVSMRGGLHTFSPLAQRQLKWCEYHLCAVQLGVPKLPPIARPPLHFADARQEAAHVSLEQMVQAVHARTLLHLPQLADTELGAIVMQLHEVSLGQMDNWRPYLCRDFIANTLDNTEHFLVVELVHIQKNRPLPAFAKSRADMVYDAVAHATQIYTWGALNPAPKNMALFKHFITRLREALEVDNLVETWCEAANPQGLLWVLFVGWTVGCQRIDRADVDWFEGALLDVAAWMQLQTESELWTALNDFPWTNAFGGEHCRKLWGKVELCLTSSTTTPTSTLLSYPNS